MFDRATVLLVLSLSTVLVCCACSKQASVHERQGPNVIMIAVDTLRRDHLGCYGYGRDTSPAIDAFAARSVRYERAFSQAPWTTASIGSLMTSLYPTQLGIEHDRSVLPAGRETLAEVLRRHGYRTGAVISHTFCSAKWNFDQARLRKELISEISQRDQDPSKG